MGRVQAAAVLVVAFAGGVMGAAIAGADPTTPPSPSPSTPSSSGSAAAGPASSGPASSGPGPVTAMDQDGTFTVGTQIAPGVYASAGPMEDTTCYWRRIGADDVTLNNAMTSQPQIVQIEPTDIAFKTRGCQPWQLTDAAVPPNQIPPWLAQLQLRRDLDILNGLAGQSGNGQLPPY